MDMTPPSQLRRTLKEWMANEPEPLQDVITRITEACKKISDTLSMGDMETWTGTTGIVNSTGEEQKKLDMVCNEGIGQALFESPHVAAYASEEDDGPVESPTHAETGDYLVAFDPLDGSGNAEANITIGTIFSILPRMFRGTRPGAAGFMQPGNRQVAAGYVLYGPSTLLVISTGKGVFMFTYHRLKNDFILVREHIRIPENTKEFAINGSNRMVWEKPVQRYITELVSGTEGPRRARFNMRWVGSMVACSHRVLIRGGIYLYPRDTREPRTPGRLRLLYEANPIAFLMEQAGGMGITGTQRILDIVPDIIHQKVPVILGSKNEVERVKNYHEDPSENVALQLFQNRSLFVQA